MVCDWSIRFPIFGFDRFGAFLGAIGPPIRITNKTEALFFGVSRHATFITYEEAQTTTIMDLVEERLKDLIGEMPLKIVYPALEGHEWKVVTGCDPKKIRWSCHNGGSWPVLLWLLTTACIKAVRPQIA